VTLLRQRMLEDLQIRHYSPITTPALGRPYHMYSCGSCRRCYSASHLTWVEQSDRPLCHPMPLFAFSFARMGSGFTIVVGDGYSGDVLHHEVRTAFRHRAGVEDCRRRPLMLRNSGV
jgi:hypothetical protein